MKRAAHILLICAACAAAGCTYASRHFPAVGRFRATDAGRIQVIDGLPDRPYELRGKVHSHCRRNWFFGWMGGGRSKMVGLLKREAAWLGADAIIGVQRSSFSQLEWTDVHYRAAAVRLRPAPPQAARSQPPAAEISDLGPSPQKRNAPALQ